MWDVWIFCSFNWLQFIYIGCLLCSLFFLIDPRLFLALLQPIQQKLKHQQNKATVYKGLRMTDFWVLTNWISIWPSLYFLNTQLLHYMNNCIWHHQEKNNKCKLYLYLCKLVSTKNHGLHKKNKDYWGIIRSHGGLIFNDFVGPPHPHDKILNELWNMALVY